VTVGLAFPHNPQAAQPPAAASAAIAHNASTDFISRSFQDRYIYYRCSAAYVGRVTLIRFISSSIYVVPLLSGARQSAPSRPSGRTAPPRASDATFISGGLRSCSNCVVQDKCTLLPRPPDSLLCYRRSLTEAIAAQPGLKTCMLVKPWGTRYWYTRLLELQRGPVQ